MSDITKGPWLRDGKTVYALNERGFNRFCFQVQDAHTPDSELSAVATLACAAPDLLDALESVEREHELLRWMKNCELRRPRGSFGIAVESDELALEWKSHRNNLDKLAEARRSAIAKARGEK